jgi:hypothetical protein
MLAMGWCGVLAMVGGASRPSGEEQVSAKQAECRCASSVWILQLVSVVCNILMCV